MYCKAGKIVVISILKEYFKSINSRFFPLLGGVFLLTLFLACTEGVGLLMLIPLMELAGVSTGESGSLPGFITMFLDNSGIELSLLTALLLYITIISLFSILKFTQSYLSLLLSESMTKEKKDKLFSQVLHSRWPFIATLKSSDIIHILSGRVGVYGSMVQTVSSILLALIMLLSYGAIAFVLSPPMTLLSIGSALIITLILLPINKKIHQVGQSFFDSNREIYSVLKESVEGIKTAKSYAIEARSETLFTDATTSLKLNTLRFMKLAQSTQALYKIGSVISISLIFYIAITVFHFEAVRLLLFILIFSRVIPQISNIHSQYHSILNTIPTYREVEELYKKTGENQEIEGTEVAPFPFRKCITLQSISFSYEKKAHFALDQVDLTIPRGTHLAVIGETGSGKSTLIDIFMGLLEADTGTVLVDGEVVHSDEWAGLRALTAYVPQVPFFFHDSIRENIRMVQPSLGDEEIWKVLEIVHAKEMVESFPHGLDTILGDRGVSISGGERQRIALARALIVKPEILILDEATNALDNNIENRVLDSLKAESGISTIITVTHKIENLHKVDQVIVMRSGRIIEKGTPEFVRNSESPYVQQLYNRA